MSTIIIGVIVAAAVVLALRSVLRDINKNSCSHGCIGCSGCFVHSGKSLKEAYKKDHACGTCK